MARNTMENRACSAQRIARWASCRRARQLVTASGLLAFAAATTCVATETSRGGVVLWSANDQWVKLEPQDDPKALPNDHPAPLTADAISTALAALQIRIVDQASGTETLRSVFTRDELRDLAPRLASGLAKAGPQQDVTFSTIASHALVAGGLIKDPGVNAGRVFYEDARLNVIFGELQSGYRKRNVYGQRNDDFTPRQQGSRMKAEKHKWPLAAAPGVQFHSASDGVRNDWIEIDGAAVAAAASDAAKAPVAAAPAAAAGSGEGPAATKSGADLEERLKTLKELRDKNLISEEAYRAKMQELLSEL
jgi:hypothetical protein